MYKKTYAFIILAALQVTSIQSATAAYGPAFSVIDPSFSTPSKETGEFQMAEDLPRRKSQDTFGSCSGESAAYLLTATNCRTQKRYQKKDTQPIACKDQPESKYFSGIDIMRYANVVPDEKLSRSFYSGISGIGSPRNILSNVFFKTMGVSNSECTSLDKTLVHFGDGKLLEEAQKKSWRKLKDMYDTKCEQCNLDFATTAATKIAEDFNIKKTNKEILEAFGQETYEKFLDQLLIPNECRRLGQQVFLDDIESLDIKSFPENPLKISNEKENLAIIKDVLSKKIPLLVNNVCLGADFDIKATQEKTASIISKGPKSKATSGNTVGGSGEEETCSGAHSVVISGYRKVCKKENSNDCRESLKIENSWGETWQKAHNDGWVDAKSFLDRTAYLGQNLLWIEDKKAK